MSNTPKPPARRRYLSAEEMKKLNAQVVQESMEKTICFRMKKHMDESLRELSKASNIPVSSLIRHCVITEAPKLAKQYGININGD